LIGSTELTPEDGAVLMQALAAARETLYQRKRTTDLAHSTTDASAETSTPAQQQADALTLLAEAALHHGLDPGAAGERYQVVVHVDAPVLEDSAAPGNPCSRAARAFPRKRPAAWRATRPE
jgi:uncharacterized protein DUF222